MSLIHKFEQGGNFFVLDVNTGAVHIVDELVYDLVDDNKLRSKEELIADFGSKYSADVISEAYEELLELVDENILYSKDQYEEIANSSMDDRDYIKAIDYVVKRSGPRRNIEIDLFGGEPTMIMDSIKEIIAYARENEKAWKKNIRFTMTTNATLLNEEMMDFMDKEMGNIILSLDGRKEVKDNVRIKVDGSGSYDDILPNIKRMIEKRDKSKHYYVRGTFTGANTDFYEDVKAMINEGFREISIEPVVLEKAHIYNKPKCKECWARFYCSGGCQANNFAFNGDIKIPYEIGCKMQKKRIECAIALKAQ